MRLSTGFTPQELKHSPTGNSQMGVYNPVERFRDWMVPRLQLPSTCSLMTCKASVEKKLPLLQFHACVWHGIRGGGGVVVVVVVDVVTGGNGLTPPSQKRPPASSKAGAVTLEARPTGVVPSPRVPDVALTSANW